jgi:hypothetical protein
LITLGSIVIASTEYVDATELGIAYSGDSDYRKTTVWGQPAPFVVDHPYNPGAGEINRDDNFRSGFFLISWVIWFVAVGTGYSVVIAGIWIAKKLSRPQHPK